MPKFHLFRHVTTSRHAQRCRAVTCVSCRVARHARHSTSLVVLVPKRIG